MSLDLNQGVHLINDEQGKDNPNSFASIPIESGIVLANMGKRQSSLLCINT